MSEYKTIGEEAFEDLKEMVLNTGSWKYYKTKKNMEVSYRKSKNFNGNVFKFKMIIPVPFQTVWDVMKPATSTEAKSWDKSIDSYTVLNILSEELQIARILSHPAVFGTVSAREFVNLFYTKATNDIILNEDHGTLYWIAAKSVVHPKAPITKNFVRGTNYPTGYVMYQLKSDPEKTAIEGYLDTDIGGMLPQRMVEAALPVQQMKYLEGVEVEATKRWQSQETKKVMS